MPDTLILHNGEEEVTFVVTKISPDGTERISDNTDLLAPETLVIRHNTVSNGQGVPQGTKVDRHLVSISRVQRDPDTEATYTATVNFTLAVPRTTNFDAAAILRLKTLCVQAVDAISVQALMRGQT